MNLTGTKHGCELGNAAPARSGGGVPVLSCLALLSIVKACDRTVEGLASGGKLHPLQAAFADLGRRAVRLLHPRDPDDGKGAARARVQPERERIRSNLGDLCRCTGYQQIYESIEEAEER